MLKQLPFQSMQLQLYPMMRIIKELMNQLNQL